MADEGRRALRLVTQCNTGYHWLGPAVKDYVALHPTVHVEIRVEARTRPVAALLNGDIDLAIVNDEVNDRRFSVRELFRDELFALVPPDHAWAGRSCVDAHDFVTEHLLLYTADRADSTVFQLLLNPAGVEPARFSGVPVTEAIVELVAAGIGVAVLPMWSIEPAVDSGRVRAIRITATGMMRTWRAVAVREQADEPWLRDFVDLMTRRGPRARRPGPAAVVTRPGARRAAR